MKVAVLFGFFASAHAINMNRKQKKRFLKAAIQNCPIEVFFKDEKIWMIKNAVEVFFKDEKSGMIRSAQVTMCEKQGFGKRTFYHCHSAVDLDANGTQSSFESFKKTIDEIELVIPIT